MPLGASQIRHPLVSLYLDDARIPVPSKRCGVEEFSCRRNGEVQSLSTKQVSSEYLILRFEALDPPVEETPRPSPPLNVRVGTPRSPVLGVRDEMRHRQDHKLVSRCHQRLGGVGPTHEGGVGAQAQNDVVNLGLPQKLGSRRGPQGVVLPPRRSLKGRQAYPPDTHVIPVPSRTATALRGPPFPQVCSGGVDGVDPVSRGGRVARKPSQRASLPRRYQHITRGAPSIKRGGHLPPEDAAGEVAKDETEPPRIGVVRRK